MSEELGMVEFRLIHRTVFKTGKSMKNFSLGTVQLSVALLCSCSNQNDGNAYVGRWTDIHGHGPALVIERNGKNFIVDFNDHYLGKVAGFMKGDLLHIEVPLSSVDLTIDAKTGHLIMPGQEFARATN